MKRHIWQVATIILLIGLFVLALDLRDSRKELNQSKNEFRQTSLFLNGDLAVEGYSCGVMDTKIAQKFIGKNLKKNFSQIPQNLSGQGSWQDSCRYTDSSNSNKYVELFINTYQNPNLAESAYTTFFQIVNENVSYPAQEYGEELVYDSGVFYLLRDRQVIRIAASNGSPMEAEQFALSVFERIIPELIN
jgi:hypothetical protein